MKLYNITPRNAFGTSLDNLYVFFTSSLMNRHTPTVLARWNGESWEFVDRFPAWVDSRSDILGNEGFVVPHPNAETILRYSPNLQLERKLCWEYDCPQPVDLGYSPHGDLFVILGRDFYLERSGLETGYRAAKLDGLDLVEIRFGTIETLWTWTFAPDGTLWAIGFRKDESPVLVNYNEQREIDLPLERAGDWLTRTLLITKNGRVIITIPYGKIFAGQLADASLKKQWLHKVGEIRPMTEGASEGDLNVRSACEAHNGVIYFGCQEGLASLRGNELVQEFDETVDDSLVPPIDFQHAFVALPDATVVCRWDGLHIMRDGQPDAILPSIDPEWFKRKGPSAKPMISARLNFIPCSDHGR